MLRRLLSVALACALAASAPAAADDYFEGTPSSTDVAVRVPKQRTTGQRLTIYGLLGGAAIATGVGVWAHLDSRAARDELEIAADDPTETWTAERQDIHDRGMRSRSIAAVGYVLGAGFLAGATVYAWMTRPGFQTVTIEPTRGGAMLGGAWSW